MFSPYYAWARQKGPADPLNHCAVNVALYGRGGRWAMTERRRGAVRQAVHSLSIGPSALHWDGASLTIDIDETTVPFPSRLRGKVRLHAEGLTPRGFALDGPGLHHWWPVSPRARIEVDLKQPRLSWQGDGYFDSNFGEVPLERSFKSWHWSRASLSQGAAVLYETQPLEGAPLSLALRFDGKGGVQPFEPPPLARLPGTLWRIGRETRADGGKAKVLKTLEDTPFYARSMLATSLLGEKVPAMHESLSLTRFDTPLVRMMLPFRMPRW